jgi:hypothetical protein
MLLSYQSKIENVEKIEIRDSFGPMYDCVFNESFHLDFIGLRRYASILNDPLNIDMHFYFNSREV